MDTLFSMDVFVRVVEQGGFTPVASDLGISGTMVGKHVRWLEDSLGVRLLNRTTRRQSLTEAGRIYFERCKVLLADVAEANASVQQTRLSPRGVLRVASPVTFGTNRLVKMLAGYLKRFPEVSVELTLNDRETDLVEEGYDAACRIGKLEDSSLIAVPLPPYRTILCASPEYLKAHGIPRKLADLASHNCLGFTYWDRRSEWRLVGAKGAESVAIRGNLTVNQGQALRMAALVGIGIVMQPEVLFIDDLKAGRLVRVLPKYSPGSRPVHLVYLPDQRMTPKLRSFIDYVKESLK